MKSARRFTEHNPWGMPWSLAEDHPAAVEGRTRYPKTRKRADQVIRVLKSGKESRKIGSLVTKGKWKGMPIFTLTLEERATCPRSCKVWLDCFGNKMHYAHRFNPTPEVMERIGVELKEHQRRYPKGFVVRLHVLGDFASLAYVAQWLAWLKDFPALHVFGYTAHEKTSQIGYALDLVSSSVWDRFAMRFSGETGPRSTRVIDKPEEATKDEIICPAQVEKSDCCGTCSLCWQTQKPVVFLRH